MARWEPDAEGRLQQAAMELFVERGYSAVTVVEIADRAGLTKRTFFNHFTDKREVLFAGAKGYEASVVKHLTEAAPDLDPMDAVMVALTLSGLELVQYGDYARLRRELISSSAELQERDLIKTAALTAAIAETLHRREVPPRVATFTAHAGITVFAIAYDDWVDDTTQDLRALIQRSLADLRKAVAHRGGTS